VYQLDGHKPRKETDALGDNHHTILPIYSITKIGAEAMARFAARQWNIPTTIARLSVPYGNNGGEIALPDTTHFRAIQASQDVPVGWLGFALFQST
jgi:nucleoside-diphosphate-sugar epimerase